MSDKSREWWIEFSGNPAHDKTRKVRYVSGEEPGWIDPSDEAIHVIEKSAYDALAAENERLREALKRIADYECGPIVDASFDNPTDARIARKALEK